MINLEQMIRAFVEDVMDDNDYHSAMTTIQHLKGNSKGIDISAKGLLIRMIDAVYNPYPQALILFQNIEYKIFSENEDYVVFSRGEDKIAISRKKLTVVKMSKNNIPLPLDAEEMRAALLLIDEISGNI